MSLSSEAFVPPTNIVLPTDNADKFGTYCMSGGVQRSADTTRTSHLLDEWSKAVNKESLLSKCAALLYRDPTGRVGILSAPRLVVDDTTKERVIVAHQGNSLCNLKPASIGAEILKKTVIGFMPNNVHSAAIATMIIAADKAHKGRSPTFQTGKTFIASLSMVLPLDFCHGVNEDEQDRRIYEKLANHHPYYAIWLDTTGKLCQRYGGASLHEKITTLEPLLIQREQLHASISVSPTILEGNSSLWKELGPDLDRIRTHNILKSWKHPGAECQKDSQEATENAKEQFATSPPPTEASTARMPIESLSEKKATSSAQIENMLEKKCSPSLPLVDKPPPALQEKVIMHPQKEPAKSVESDDSPSSPNIPALIFQEESPSTVPILETQEANFLCEEEPWTVASAKSTSYPRSSKMPTLKFKGESPRTVPFLETQESNFLREEESQVVVESDETTSSFLKMPDLKFKGESSRALPFLETQEADFLREEEPQAEVTHPQKRGAIIAPDTGSKKQRKSLSALEFKAMTECHKVLAECHMLNIENPPKLLVAICSGYKCLSSKTISTAFRKLIEDGVIQNVAGQKVALTKYGVATMPKVTVPKTNAEAHRRYKKTACQLMTAKNIPLKMDMVWRQLADGESHSKKALASAAGYTSLASKNIQDIFKALKALDIVNENKGKELQFKGTVFPFGRPCLALPTTI